MSDSRAIDRLGVPPYNWWNESLHGLARAGRATVFPQAIGLAATWDTDLMFRVAIAISDEVRARHQDLGAEGRNIFIKGPHFLDAEYKHGLPRDFIQKNFRMRESVTVQAASRCSTYPTAITSVVST